MSLLQNSNAISTGGAYNLESSLRFRRSANAYLSRTPASAGNRKTWTLSVWVKRGIVTSGDQPFLSYIENPASGTSGRGAIGFQGGDKFFAQFNISGTWYELVSSSVYRDTSAWYHVVVTLDTTQSTSSNRLKIYVNG